ncbi:MAG TPA: aldose epimerase family protein [Lachnospiraceae bacterium]|nr:aldose epimerase family protein [Lachnospiraceae bacterium]
METAKELFGKTKEGKEIYLYTLENRNGVKAQVTDFGAILVNLFVPNKEGKMDDVVLGYDKLQDYFVNASNFGSTIGPNANRIGNASFILDGITYKLDKNDGPNNLHSHLELGFHKKVWDVVEGKESITFSVKKKDGEMGFPGNVSSTVTYSLNEDNELAITYFATSDKNTIINMTNHTYFNLAGHNGPNIHDEMLWIKASHYTAIAEGAIPTGDIAPVIGTPMDFLKPRRIGDDIDGDFPPIVLTGGYDHNWVVDEYNGSLQLIARVDDKVAGRSMEVYTDLPGVQFYAGNFIEKTHGKNGATYGPRKGLCLETQFYPDTANKPQFPSAVFGPNREYHTTTIYKFI